MNINYVSAKVIAEKLIDEYNITDDDILIRCSNIVLSELGKLAPQLLTFDNVVYLRRGVNQFKMPKWMKSIIYIEHIFDERPNQNHYNAATILQSNEWKNNNGVVQLLIKRRCNIIFDETGAAPPTEQPCLPEAPSDNVFSNCDCKTDIKIVYRHLNVIYDEDTNVWWPMVPEAYRLQDYLVKCVLLGYINRGYQMPHIQRNVLLQEVQLARRGALNDIAEFGIDKHKLLTEYLHSMHVYSITEDFDSIIDKHLSKQHSSLNPYVVDNPAIIKP